jgi:nicotinamidase-related amidase
MRHDLVLDRDNSLLLVIDVQQAMAGAIRGFETIVDRIRQLTSAAGIMKIPVMVTEHYKKGFGGTVCALEDELKEATCFQKEFFSAGLEDNFLETVAGFKRKQIVVCGMETHVCVLQTGMDLIQAGYQLHVVRNAVASRYEEDRDAALNLFKTAGAVITTAEIAIFQWVCRSNTALFREVLPVIKRF